MTGTGYFLTEDEVRYLRGLEERIAMLEAQSLAEVPVGSVISYRPPVRSSQWSDSRFDAVGSNWNHWHMLNDFNSSVVADQSGDPAFSGTLAALSPSSVPLLGQLGGLSSDGGKSVYFWGKERSRIDLPLLISSERGWTMEAIFKPETLPQLAFILYNGLETTDGFGIGIADATGAVSGSNLVYRAGGAATINTGIVLSANQWYDVIFVANSGDNKLYWYVSTITPLTKEFTISSGSSAQAVVTPTTRAVIGARDQVGTASFKGWVEEITTWESMLSGAEVQKSALDRLRASLEPAPPFGWAKTDGINVSRSEFARLFNRIGTKEGAGDGVNTFALPNIAGSIIRI